MKHYPPWNKEKREWLSTVCPVVYALLFCCFPLKKFPASTMYTEMRSVFNTGMSSVLCVGNWCSCESTLSIYCFGLQTCKLFLHFLIHFMRSLTISCFLFWDILGGFRTPSRVGTIFLQIRRFEWEKGCAFYLHDQMILSVDLRVSVINGFK